MGKQTILIIDDQPQQIRLVANILGDLAVQISVARTTQQAMTIMSRMVPDLILLDVQLDAQDINGFEFCRHLKHEEQYRDVPVLFMTANRDNYTIEQSFEAGGADYIAKPFTERGLRARVANQLMLVKEKQRSDLAFAELNQFTHTVSHDLKSPLLLMTQLAQCLKSQELSDTQRLQFITQMIEKCEYMSEMVTRLLELSKLSELKLRQEVVHSQELVEDLIAEFEQLYPEQHFRIHLSDLPIIKGDQTLLRLLFQNVLSNAFKFSHKEVKPEIKISVKETLDQTEILIEDNGVGFKPHQATKLFQIFERLHTDTAFEGTGVGLVICQKIMDKHDGQITLTSDGQHTTVCLIFPQSRIDSIKF